MNIGLYFGTFNPIHIGHLVIANHIVEQTILDQVWFVVTPQNPLKNKSTLLKDSHRLAMVREAVYDSPKLKASDIEFGLSKPNYTASTLAHIMDKHPDHSFSLIMGEDNLRNFHKWKNYENILSNHTIYVYPRVLTPQEEDEYKSLNTDEIDKLRANKNIIYCQDAPVMRISASFIRKSIKENNDVRFLLSEPVHKYVEEMHFYK
ncbi:MAG: nicotinate-nucleotide adenylyltransferase [Flavobacteriales bacterium]|jgi:nicotinate-nucleotide adenylyltransferase|nr:nicotinate-nucleotide adenylyltransferase [Flavobacteriales bacterium]MBT5933556.1 nicotinate-nucleotide adenylyltransferase [Flavobacteriales bacterium]MDA7762484.1 nicotinate (nicotinamide) nucleotide adenylyltransferase [Crocinitomicaceae bacterium]MDO7610031.1 nicotinate (nicotinamide) nucleotide adenylyltransferase [Crocinitomicaceae bacterium]